VAKWNWRSLLLFEAIVCIVSLVFSLAGSLSPRQIILTIPPLGLSIRSNAVLLLLSSFVPGVALLAWSKECRTAVLRFRAGTGVYVAAILIGFALPFASYLGAGSVYPLPWNASTVPTLVRVFLINILMSPLWEEIIWRAYFYRKVSSMLPINSAIVVSSLGFTVWHAGFLFALYHSGIRAAVLIAFVPQLFFAGIILCSLFTMAHDALAPCVILHTAFNASTYTYFSTGNRVNDLGSYIAGSVFMLIVAIIVFRMALRRARESSALIESRDVSI
jgi:membrane protease YdiL (CAAX protease family)